MSLRPTIKISATIIVQFHGCEIYRLETQSYHRQKMYNWMLKYNFDVYARAIRTFQPGLHIWSPTILKANMSVVLHTIKYSMAKPLNFYWLRQPNSEFAIYDVTFNRWRLLCTLRENSFDLASRKAVILHFAK